MRAHNRVNAAVLARSTPLPFRFGTLADGRRLADYVSANEAALLSALARVRGSVEMGVKIRWEAEKAEVKRRKAKEESEEAEGRLDAEAGGGAESELSGGARDQRPGGGSGTAFLLARRREILGDEALRRRAEEVAAWLASRVSELVRESSARTSPSEALVLRAAHLVERARLGEYRARVRELSGERAGLHFLASGPWPPYSFSEIGRE